MMEKTKKNIPEFRFPGFSGEWVEKKLQDVAKIERGKSKHRPRGAEFLYGGEYPFVQTGDIRNADLYLTTFTQTYSEDGLKQSKLWDEDTLCITIAANIAETTILKIKACFPDSIIGLIPYKEKAAVLFIKYQFDKFKLQIQNLSQGAAQDNLNQEKLLNIKFRFTTLPEQYKISSFITEVNEKLRFLTKKKTLLEQYKKGVMQKIFSQELRFKDDNGNEFPDWEERVLGEVAKRITTKNKAFNTNVLTISAQYGLISQLEYFNKSVSAKDVSGYYLLEKNDFAYNKSYSNGYPMGAIKRLARYEKGIVSTLYICFRNNELFDNAFAEQYFETGIHNKEIEKVAQEGARNHGLLNIGVSDFFNTYLFIPSLPEQTKIANFLSAIDEKIALSTIQIEKTEQYKKGLLQKMFV